MTTSLILPGPAALDPLGQVSGALFSWAALDRRWSPIADATGGAGLLRARTTQHATFGRADAATILDTAGRLLVVPATMPRWEVVSGLTVLLTERAGSNACTAPEAFDDAAWTKTNVTVTANTRAAPTAAAPTAADAVRETVTSGTHEIGDALSGLTAGAVQSAVLHVRPAGRTVMRWYFVSGSDRVGLEATLTGAGSVANYTTGAGQVALARVDALADGWYRLVLAGVINAGSTTADIRLALSNGASYSYAGSTALGVDLWGAMVELNRPRPGTYVATTRGAETLSYALSWGPQPLTVYAQAVIADAPTTAVGWVNLGGGATPSAPRLLLQRTGTAMQVLYHDGSTSLTASVSVSPADLAIVEQRAVLRPSGGVVCGVSVAGGAETVATNESATLALPSAWGVGTIELGRGSSTATGLDRLARVLIVAGEHDLATMRGWW